MERRARRSDCVGGDGVCGPCASTRHDSPSAHGDGTGSVTGDTLEVILRPSVDVVVGMPRWAGAHYAGITLGTAQRPRIHFRDSIPHAREVWPELAHVEQLRERERGLRDVAA